MKKILRNLIKYWYAYLLVLVAMLAQTGLGLLQPIIIMKIVDDVIIGGKTKLLGMLLLIILGITLGKSFGCYIKELTIDKISVKITSIIRKDLFSHIQGLSMDYFDKTGVGEIMARIKDDVDNLWNVIGFVGMLITEICIYVVIVMVCMFSLNPLLASVVLVVMATLGVIAVVMEKKLGKVYGCISEENAKLTSVVEENLVGVRTVKAFARENYEIEKFVKHNNKFYDLHIEQSKCLTKYFPFFQFASKLLPVGMTILGGFLVINNNLTLGVLLAFVEYCRNIVWPMENLGWVSNEMSAGIAAFRKLDKIYKQVSNIKEKEDAIELPEVKGKIEFNNVSFRKDDKTILEDISFEIEPGKSLGIMGATGSGKTSIINLLVRFFDVSSGKIRVDGVDIEEMKLKQLRSSISTVMQDAFLFSDTIEENIKMGQRISMKDENMLEASEIASADGFIDKLESKYKTVIGEKGVGLSGGQKQRISIARAISKNSPILVMDDSTSALDMETESKIQNALEHIDATKIIIAHRISAVSKADEIIFLDKGRIKERGTHNQLMNKKGLYYKTYMAQYGSHY